MIKHLENPIEAQVNTGFPKERILLVDDHLDCLDILEAIILPAGYETIRATSGREALDIIRQADIDLVILDVMMPVMSGYETARLIRLEKKTPIILLTALKERECVIRGLENGADEFMVKPVIKEEFLLRIKHILELKKHHDALENMVLKRTRKLRLARDMLLESNHEVVKRLLMAVEYKDDEIGRHIIRVGKYSQILVQKLGLGPRLVEIIEYAAQMHDIGKVGIPDSILFKRGRLTPQEFEVMKTHTVIGGRILGDSPHYLLKAACEIAFNHHERWDGLGYPCGKKARDIPVSGRIVAVSDVFDAITSARPYKKPLEWEESLGIIKAESGRSFDPWVVEAFFKALDQIRDIYGFYKDTPDKGVTSKSQGE